MNVSLEVQNAIANLRKKHKAGTHISVFPDGTILPWRLLTTQEVIRYSRFANDGQHLPIYLEDEIFQTCILDDFFVKRLNHLKAGIVTSVVEHIWQYSSLSSVDQFNISLDNARTFITAENGILHELVQYITLAFPYKPDEVYAMDIEQLFHIFALAEKKLLTLGMISQPFHAQDQTATQTIEKPISRQDPKQIWEQIHGIAPAPTDEDEAEEILHSQMVARFARMREFQEPQPDIAHPFKAGEQEALLARARGEQPKTTWRDRLNSFRQQRATKRKSILPTPEELPPEIMNDPNISPIIKYGGAHDAERVDFAVDEIGIMRSLPGHELVDLDINRELMVREARQMYAKELKYLEEVRAKHQQRLQAEQTKK